jgi:hypothetical protein
MGEHFDYLRNERWLTCKYHKKYVMDSFVLSCEQQVIIDEIKKGKDVSVNAVAGSGKTTTVIQLAKQVELKILQLTYNAALKMEVRNKVVTEGLQNLEVHSYHSFAVGYYDHHAHTDTALSRVVYQNKPPRRGFNYDIIVADEAQDMTLLLFHFVKKVIQDNPTPVQLVIMGDVRQAIYEFKGSDQRFLSHCSDVFGRSFTELPLSRSYRLTDSISAFVNHEMLGKRVIHTQKPGAPVTYLIKSAFDPNPIVSMIKEYLSMGHTYEDIFILSPSVKSHSPESPISKLENRLVEEGIPISMPLSDEKIEEKVLSGKIVFSTFHQSKGRERPIVFVLSFDASWFTYYGKGKDVNMCPNELYVAVTRASKALIVVHHPPEKPGPSSLPFLRTSISEMYRKEYIHVVIAPYSKPDNRCRPQNLSKCSVTDLTRFIKEEALLPLQQWVDVLFKPFSPIQRKTAIPSTVTTEYGLVECVSDLNGIAIPNMWQQKTYQMNGVRCYLMSKGNDVHKEIRKRLSLLPDEICTPSDYLLLASLLYSHDTGYISRLVQLTDYAWLTDSMVSECHRVLDVHLTNGPYRFEYELMLCEEKESQENKFKQPYFETEAYKVELQGRVDALSPTELWEFKCVDAFTIEHFLQTVVYGYIWNTFMRDIHGPRRCILLNMRTNEGYELDMTSQGLKEVVQILVENKFHSNGLKPFSEWKRECDAYVPIKQEGIQRTLDPYVAKIPVSRLSSSVPPAVPSTSLQPKRIQTSITQWLGTSLQK